MVKNNFNKLRVNALWFFDKTFYTFCIGACPYNGCFEEPVQIPVLEDEVHVSKPGLADDGVSLVQVD